MAVPPVPQPPCAPAQPEGANDRRMGDSQRSLQRANFPCLSICYSRHLLLVSEEVLITILCLHLKAWKRE